MIAFHDIKRCSKTLLVFFTACAGYVAAQTGPKIVVLDAGSDTMTIQGCLLQSKSFHANKDYITREGSLKNLHCEAHQQTEHDGIRNYINCKPTDIKSSTWSLQRNYRSGIELPTDMFPNWNLDASGKGPLEPFAAAAEKINEYAKKCDAVKRIDYEDLNDPLNPRADREYVASMRSSNAALEAKDRKEWLQKFQKVVEAFRKNVKVGDDSNCGLVIEVKAPIISVQTQIGVQWLKIAQIYPGGMSCEFVNGVYQPRPMPVN